MIPCTTTVCNVFDTPSIRITHVPGDLVSFRAKSILNGTIAQGDLVEPRIIEGKAYVKVEGMQIGERVSVTQTLISGSVLSAWHESDEQVGIEEFIRTHAENPSVLDHEQEPETDADRKEESTQESEPESSEASLQGKILDVMRDGAERTLRDIIPLIGLNTWNDSHKRKTSAALQDLQTQGKVELVGTRSSGGRGGPSRVFRIIREAAE